MKNTYTVKVYYLDGTPKATLKGIIGKAEAESQALHYRRNQYLTTIEKEAK